jgi:ABC-type transporter Mla subunit MlaD
MAEYQPPSPAAAEVGGGGRVSSPPPPEPQTDRIRSVERAVGEVTIILNKRLPDQLNQQSEGARSHLSALARELGAAFRTLLDDIRELRTAVGETVATSEDRLSRALAGAETRLGDAVSRASEAVRLRLDEGMAAIEGETASMKEGLHRNQAAMDDRLEGTTAGIQDQLTETMDALRAVLEQTATGLRADLEAFRGLPAQLGEGVAAVRDAVAEMAAAHAGVEERLGQVAAAASAETLRAQMDQTGQALGEKLGEAAGEMRWEVQDVLKGVQEQLGSLAEGVRDVQAETDKRAATLQEGLQRVDKLAEAVETIGRRRGFRHVVESDERIREEQAAMVDRLADAAQVLSSHMEEVRAELGELQRTARDAQAGVLAEEIRRRVVDELVSEQMVATMMERVQTTFDERFQELVSRVDARLAESFPPGRERRRFRKG